MTTFLLNPRPHTESAFAIPCGDIRIQEQRGSRRLEEVACIGIFRRETIPTGGNVPTEAPT